MLKIINLSLLFSLALVRIGYTKPKVEPDLQKLQKVAEHVSLEAPISFLPKEDRLHTSCTAVAIYNEARGEPEFDQFLVARTILNRAKSISECKIIASPGQFPWVKKLSINWSPKEALAWQRAQYVAFMTKYSNKYNVPKCPIRYFSRALPYSFKRYVTCSLSFRHHIYFDMEHQL